MAAVQVLIQPLITEKSTLLQEEGKYVFKVVRSAPKGEIKRAVEEAFGVKVTDVKVAMVRGKRKRYGPKYKKLPDTKKAIVTLRQGDRIQLIEGV